MTRDLAIERAFLGSDAGLLGAGVLAFSELLARPEPVTCNPQLATIRPPRVLELERSDRVE